MAARRILKTHKLAHQKAWMCFLAYVALLVATSVSLHRLHAQSPYSDSQQARQSATAPDSQPAAQPGTQSDSRSVADSTAPANAQSNAKQPDSTQPSASSGSAQTGAPPDDVAGMQSDPPPDASTDTPDSAPPPDMLPDSAADAANDVSVDSPTDSAKDSSSSSRAVEASVPEQPASPQVTPAAIVAQPEPAAAAVVQPLKPSVPLSPEDARRQQVATEVGDLLKMATDLKAEVDKTTKDELSIAVIRKAGAIEQYSHKLRDDPRLAAGKEEKQGGQPQ